jgi:hypothetical protein
MSEMVTLDCIQRLKGPQPSKKGRMPGPGWEGNGAGVVLLYNPISGGTGV